MFGNERRDGSVARMMSLAELIFHATARQVRKGHRSGGAALFMNVLQTVIFIAAFYVMFSVLGLQGQGIRGDFILFLMTGIFLFLTHIKTIGSIVGAEGPASPMMKHGPMNTAVSITAAALSALYLQTMSMFIVLFGVHVAWYPIDIHDPAGTAMMFLLAWFTGIGIGLVLLALKPWMPNVVQVANTIYSRVNMIASGKMFVANSLPTVILPFFAWNPLFHTIDQARGHAFVNYSPHYTNWEYPVGLALATILIGLMGEFYTRRRASLSWFAGR